MNRLYRRTGISKLDFVASFCVQNVNKNSQTLYFQESLVEVSQQIQYQTID